MTLLVVSGRGGMQRLGRLELEQVGERALAAQAVALADAARAAGTPDGEVTETGNGALVGWRSPGVRRRERGDAGLPPQPVLARVVVARGRDAAQAVGVAVAEALRGA